ncbi:MAG TPA: regulatory protein RecX [Gammaproteobacteria bacterium]
MRKKKRPDSSPETPEQTARRLALGLLARREHSFHELAVKLAQRGLDDDVIETALDALQAENLLSEERFVEQFVRSRIERGDGPMKIRAELAQRGIDLHRAEQEIEAQDPDWVQLADAQRRKRFGAEIPVEFAERARQARFLQGRGFGMGEIQRALKGDIEE